MVDTLSISDARSNCSGVVQHLLWMDTWSPCFIGHPMHCCSFRTQTTKRPINKSTTSGCNIPEYSTRNIVDGTTYVAPKSSQCSTNNRNACLSPFNTSQYHPFCLADWIYRMDSPIPIQPYRSVIICVQYLLSTSVYQCLCK